MGSVLTIRAAGRLECFERRFLEVRRAQHGSDISNSLLRYFKTAWYQKAAVNRYLSSYITTEAKTYYSENNYTDFNGRGVPDVSAHSLYP